MRTAAPFAAPKPRKAKKPKRDTPDEARERAHVWRRDGECGPLLDQVSGWGHGHAKSADATPAYARECSPQPETGEAES